MRNAKAKDERRNLYLFLEKKKKETMEGSGELEKIKLREVLRRKIYGCTQNLLENPREK